MDYSWPGCSGCRESDTTELISAHTHKVDDVLPCMS